MKPWLRNLLIASTVAALVYLGIAIPNYLFFRAHQWIPGQPAPDDVTSFPPSYAFFAATPFGILAFIVTIGSVQITALFMTFLRERRESRKL